LCHDRQSDGQAKEGDNTGGGGVKTRKHQSVSLICEGTGGGTVAARPKIRMAQRAPSETCKTYHRPERRKIRAAGRVNLLSFWRSGPQVADRANYFTLLR
jgi:hypothetical protein